MGPKAAGHASGCLDSVPGPRADSCCVFYGWVILAVCISVKVVGTSGTLRMITFTVPGMMADPALAMPPSELSTLFSLGTLTGALGAPYLGGLIDRYGARTCLPLGCLMAAAALVTLSVASSPPMLVLGFLLVRMMSLGGILQWASVPVSHWFEKGRGRAQSYMIVVSTLICSVILFPTWQTVIQAEGWRFAMRCAALVSACMAVPTALLVYHEPESVGCQPDGEADYAGIDAEEEKEQAGDEEQHASEGSPLASPGRLVQVGGRTVVQKAGGGSPRKGGATTPRGSAARSFTLREALRTSAFYLICADNVVGCILGAGVFFHLIPIIRENGGGDVNIALALTLPMGVTEAAASLCIGRLIDKQMPPRFILGFTNLLQMCITLVFPYINTTPRAVAMGITRGVYQGTAGGLRSTIIPNFFGRRHMGRLQGVQSSLTMAGTALGPLLIGLGHDHWDAYNPALRRLAILPGAVAVLVLCFLRKPVHTLDRAAGESQSIYSPRP